MNISFPNTQRARAIVLTDHEVDALSNAAHRNVRDELVFLSAEAFSAKTKGQLMRALSDRLTRITATPRGVVPANTATPRRVPGAHDARHARAQG